MVAIAEVPNTESGEKLTVSLKLGWGTGAFGIAILMNGISGLILFFIAGILKIEPALAGGIIFLAKIFDVFTDPAVGVWSDKFKSPRGRRRPFLFWGSIISAISFAAIFTTPVFDNQWITAAYVFVALCIYAFGYTLFNIPYMSMPAEMTDNYHERSSIHAYRIVFISLGGFIASALVPAALERLGRTEASSFATIGIACGVMILISTMISYFSTAKARFTETSNAAPKLIEEFNAVRGNKHFLRLIGVKFAQLMGMQTTLAAFIFFIVQYMQVSLDVFVVFGVVTTVTTIIFAPLLVKFSKKYGKRQAYYLAAVANIIYSLSWSLAGEGEPTWAIAIRAFIVGIAVTGNVVMAMSMLTDIINHDAKKTGVRREGAFTSVYSFVEKFTGAFGPLLVGFALSLGGFNNKLPPDAPQGGNVDIALLFSVSWLPAVFGLIAIWLLSGYKLTEEEINGGEPTEKKA